VPELLIDLLKLVAAYGMVIDQVVVLLDHVADLGSCQAVGQDLRLRLHLAHQFAVRADDLANLPLQVGPNLLFVLDDVLGLVQLVLQVLDFFFELAHLVVLILLEVGQHLLEDEDLRLGLIPLPPDLIYLHRCSVFPLLVACLEGIKLLLLDVG